MLWANFVPRFDFRAKELEALGCRELVKNDEPSVFNLSPSRSSTSSLSPGPVSSSTIQKPQLLGSSFDQI